MPASDWNEICQQTICWEPMTGRDGYGKPTYGTAQTFWGRRVFTELRRNASGQGPGGSAVDIASGSYVWILGVPAVNLEDRVYVLGDTTYPPVLNVTKWPDETGIDIATKVTLGSAIG